MRYDITGNWLLIGRWWVRLSDGYRLPAIQGGTSANTVMEDIWAFGDDDDEAQSNTLDSENTDRPTQVADENFHLRMMARETNTKTDPWSMFVYCRYEGGTWQEVGLTASAGLPVFVSAALGGGYDEQNLSAQRLSSPAGGTFTTGLFDDGSSALGCSNIGLNNTYSEWQFCLQIDSTYASNGDTFEFRLEGSGGVVLDSYADLETNGYPTATASISEIPTANVTSGITLGESVAVTPLVLADVAKSDGITIGDSPSASVTAVPDRSISTSDGLTFGDSANLTPLVLGDVTKSDGITIGDAVTDIERVSGAPSEWDITGVSDGITLADSPSLGPLVLGDVTVSDGITIGESVSATLDDLVLAVSDGITITDTVVNVTIPGEAGPTLAVDLGIDNLDAWVQGVVVYA